MAEEPEREADGEGPGPGGDETAATPSPPDPTVVDAGEAAGPPGPANAKPAPAAAEGPPPAPPPPAGAPWPALALILLFFAAGGAYLVWRQRAAGPAGGPSPAASPDAGDPGGDAASLSREQLEATLQRLERTPPAEVVEARRALRRLREQVDALPPGERVGYELRLETTLGKALELSSLQAVAELEGAYAAGDYAALGQATAARLELYGLIEREPPVRLAELDAKARAALVDGAGERERAEWARAEGSDDPLEVLRVLDGFAERYPFSPVLDEVEARRAWAEAEAPGVVPPAEGE